VEREPVSFRTFATRSALTGEALLPQVLRTKVSTAAVSSSFRIARNAVIGGTPRAGS
jgi:hypothetical protein